MPTYGYARVSREDQELALQVDALVAAGVPPGNIVRDKMSGVADRFRFARLLDKLQPGDTLVTWKVHRLGRSALATLRTFQELDEKGVRLIVTTLGIDTKTTAGRLVLGIMTQLAEFEREQIVERTVAGLEAAKRLGKKLGRKPLLTCMQARQAAEMVRPASPTARLPIRWGIPLRRVQDGADGQRQGGGGAVTDRPSPSLRA